MVLAHVLLTFCIAAILAPFSHYAGQAARLFRLPQITGYLLAGIVCGPFLLGILSTESVKDLNIIEGACLSIIGLAAGAELDLPSLQRSRKQVLGITAGICLGTWLLCFAAFDWVLSVFQILGKTDTRHVLAVASLAATLMMTRSPASAIAVLREVDGKGAFSSLVMAVVVVKDVVVIVAYALNMEAIRPLLSTSQGSGLQLINVVLPVVSVMLSMTVGVFGGVLLGALLRPKPQDKTLLPATHPEAKDTRQMQNRPMYKMAVILTLSTLVFQLADYFEAEPLLACVTMGMVLVNRRHERSDKDREEIHHWVSSIMSVTNVAFFGLVGASLRLSALKDMLAPALILVLVRLVAIYLGSWLGCYFTQSHPEHRRLFWASMVTQAGVALGLARLAGVRFPDWGPIFQTYMMAIILINLLVGPPLFRWSLVQVGEAKVSRIGSGTSESGAMQMRALHDMASGKVLEVEGPLQSQTTEDVTHQR